MCDLSAGPAVPKRLRISELNPHLLCALCGGYLIDATTIIECLHSFCKTCILRYLETSNYCPICEVLIHKTRPWQNIRLDHSLQNAVYKMVPGLFQNEMRRRRDFYEKQNLQDKRGRSSSQPQGELGDRIIFSQDEEFSISIEFSPDGKPVKEVKDCKAKSLKRPKGKCQPDKRYLKCPAGLRIEHLKKFIRYKFSLPQTLQIDLFYETEPLCDTFSLMDVAYIYGWKRDCVLRLFYSFYEIPSKVRKVEAVANVTEKIAQNKVKDKTEDKAGKRDNDKRARGKREKSRDKKQGKLSGKRKVSADGATSASNVSSKQENVAGEIAEAGPNLKCKESGTETRGDSLSTSLDVSTCPEMDTNNLISDKCCNKGHIVFQSPTKQKPPPNTTASSASVHSSNTDRNNIPKDQDKKTIKLLIKSSDIKDCKSQNGETRSDNKCLKGTASSKVNYMKYQNGESDSISNSNLFEKMNTFAMTTQPKVKELITCSDSSSGHLQILAVNNCKKIKEADVKCGIKLNMNITLQKSMPKPSQQLDNLKLSKIIVSTDQLKQTQDISSHQVKDTKSRLSITKSNKQILDGTVVFKEQTFTETKDTTAAHTLDQNTSNKKMEAFQSEPGKIKKALGTIVVDTQDIFQRVQQDSCQSKVMNQVTNQKEEKLGSHEDTSSSGSNEQNNCKQIMRNTAENTIETQQHSGIDVVIDDIQSCNDTKYISSKQRVNDTRQRCNDTNSIKQVLNDTRERCDDTKQNSSMQVVNDNRSRCDDTKQNCSKQLVNDTRQICDDTKQNSCKQITCDLKQMVESKPTNAKRIVDESKERSFFSKQTLPETTPNMNSVLATIPKMKQISSITHASKHKLQNGSTKRHETASIESMTTAAKKKPRIPESAVLKVIKDTRESNDPLFSLHDQGYVKTENVRQQEHSPSIQKLPSPAHQNLGTAVLISKASSLQSDTAANITAISNSRDNSPQVKPSFNGSLVVSSVKPVSGTATTTTSSLSSAPPKLLKTTVTTASSYGCLPTTCSIASIVSVPAVSLTSINKSTVIATSQALSTSTTSTTTNSSTLSKSCDITSTVLTMTSAAAMSNTTLTVSLVPPVTTSTLSSSLGSKVKDALSISKEVKDADTNTASLVSEVTLTASTSSPSNPRPSSMPSALVSSTVMLDKITPTLASSKALPVSASPSASSIASSTVAIANTVSSLSTTTASSWSTNTAVNVANTFLNILPTETSPLKDTQARKNHRASEDSSFNIVVPKEDIKLDNFLFDTKITETETPLTVSSQRLKDDCTAVRQAQKHPLRTKTNSSAQLHGFTNDKCSPNTQSHTTAIHFLPKTISHTSKPYSVARSMSVSSTSAGKCSNMIQTTKISTLIPKSSSISSKSGAFSKSFSYPSTINNVPSSRSFLHTSLATQVPRPDLAAVMNGAAYERAMLHKTSALSSSLSLQTSQNAPSASHHRTSSKHGSKVGDNKIDKTQKNKSIPPLTIPKSCLMGTTLKLQRSPGSTDHYIFAPLNHYPSTANHNGERSKSKEVKHNGSKTPTSPPTPTKDCVFIGERQRVPTIKISDINRNPIIVDSGSSGNGNSTNRHHSQYRSYGSSRSSISENGSVRAHSRGGSDSSSPTGSSDRSDRSPARDARRPSDSELLMTHHWHEYSAADLLFNGFKLPTHPKFHDLHYDTDAMPLDYSQSSSKS